MLPRIFQAGEPKMEPSSYPDNRLLAWMERWLCASRKRFYLAFAGIIGIALLLGILPYFWIELVNSDLLAANDHLTEALRHQDSKIGEARLGPKQLDNVRTRKMLIELLQENRQQALTIFNFLARGIPPEIALTSVSLEGDRLTVQGLTGSMPPLVRLMRALDETTFLRQASLLELRRATTEAGAAPLQSFTIEAYAGPGRGDTTAKPSAISAKSAVNIPAITAPAGNASSSLAFAVPVAILCLLAAVAVFIFWRKRRRSRNDRTPSPRTFWRTVDGQMRALEPGNLDSWAFWPRLLVLLQIFVLIVAALYLLLLEPAAETLEMLHIKQTQLMREFLDRQRVAARIESSRLQPGEAEMAAFLAQLPEKHDSSLVASIGQLAQRHTLRVDLIEAKKEELREFFAVLPITLRAGGSFDAIGHFAADLGRMTPIVRLGNFRLEAQGGTAVLAFDSTLQAYRLLDAEEQARMKKAAKAAKQEAK